MAKFFLWGKKSDETPESKEVSTLEAQISKMKQDLVGVKREAEASIVEANVRMAAAQKEESHLRSLKGEVASRIKLALKREDDARDMEETVADRAKMLQQEALKIRDLQGMGDGLRAQITNLEAQKTEKESSLHTLANQGVGMRKDLAKIRDNVTRTVQEAQARLDAAKKEEVQLKTLREQAKQRTKLAETKEEKLIALEKQIEHGERALKARENQLQRIFEQKEAQIAQLRTQEDQVRQNIARAEKALQDRQALVSQISSQLGELRRHLSGVEVESTRRIEEAKREEERLKSLRKSAGEGVKLAERKTHQLKFMEQKLSERMNILKDKESHVAQLKEEEAQALARIHEIEEEATQKEQAVRERIQSAMNEFEEAAKNKEQDVSTRVERIESRLKLKEEEAHTRMSVLEEQKEQLLRQKEEVAKAKLGELKQQVDERKSDLAQTQKALGALTQELGVLLEKRDEISRLEKDLQQLMIKERQLQHEISRKSTLVTQRESELQKKESAVEEKKKELESLRAQVVALEQKERQSVSLLEDKKGVLNELRKAIVQNSETISELKVHEQRAQKAAEHLIGVERSQQKHAEMLSKKEADLLRRERAWLNQETALKEASHLVARERETLAKDVREQKTVLGSLQREWDEKVARIQEDRSSIQKEKADVRKLIEADVAGLQDKEEELIQAIMILEQDKKKLEVEELSLIKRVAEIDNEKERFERSHASFNVREKKLIEGERIVSKGLNFIDGEKKKLEVEKDTIYRARELKKALPAMERQYEQMRKDLGKLQSQAMEAANNLSKKRVMTDEQQMLIKREETIHAEARRLMIREREVEELEDRKERAFTSYLREETEREQYGKPGKELVNPDLHAMIDDAREHLSTGQIDDAVRMVSEVEYLVDKQVRDPDQKRLLMYDIRDLKASIKLSTLA